MIPCHKTTPHLVRLSDGQIPKQPKQTAGCWIGDLEMNPHHRPVLVEEVIRLLEPKAGESYFDGTAGYGGHAEAVATKIGNGQMTLVDRDTTAVEVLRAKFGDRADIRRATYLEAATDLASEGRTVDLVLLDLGLSTPQLETAGRGFSFRHPGPLDMRMDQSSELTAESVVNNYSFERLADLIGRYGEEHRARSVARAIVAARPIESTTQLAEVITRVVGRGGHIDPATRTFQALRIEVNDELGQLETALPKLIGLLAPNGRIAVISFHSLEDRIVKTIFETESRDCICPPGQPICTCDHRATIAKLTKRPISGLTHDPHNPRARSAKLRAARKLIQNQKKEAKS